MSDPALATDDQLEAATLRYRETHHRKLLFQAEVDRLDAALAEARGIVEGCKRVIAALQQAHPSLAQGDPGLTGDSVVPAAPTPDTPTPAS